MASPTVRLSRLKELQDLLRSLFIARRAPNLSIRALAMQVMTEAAKLRRAEHAQYSD
jgi:hypothetical protein